MLDRLVDTAFPGRKVVDVRPLDGGFRNANFILRLDGRSERTVLRIYEHDASLCQKELDLIRLVRGEVPVAEVLHAQLAGCEELPAFAFLRFVEGVTFRELRRSGGREAVAQAAASVGETLAAIGRFVFPTPGWLGPGPAVTWRLVDGSDPFPRFVDACLASRTLQDRTTTELREHAHAVMWEQSPELARLAEESRLTHGDFNTRNVLVREDNGRWAVAAVLDWEFAVSGAPLADVANFLRDEGIGHPAAEPHFSQAYVRAGGVLPDVRDWRRLARLVDLVALCEVLARDDLPEPIAAEVRELVRATVDDRDPQLA
jgi:aminoglycoside phosphotransferase (APT) family kinase protein